MEKLEIERKANTPSVSFNPDSGQMKIEGRSIPENPGEFYDILIEWVKDYFINPKNSTIFDLNLEYVNSGSSKYLLGLFKVIKEESSRVNNNVQINWYYEEDDEAILSLGEHYKSTIKLPFNLIEYI